MKTSRILQDKAIPEQIIVQIKGGAVLVLPTRVYLRALKAGKRWKRREHLKRGNEE